MKKYINFRRFRSAIFSSRLRSYKSNIIDVLLLSSIGLLSITWFRGDFLIDRGDFDLPLNRLRGLIRSIYLWDDNISFGTLNSRIVAAIPYHFFFALSEVIGFSLVTAEKILFYFSFTFCGLASYYLTLTLVKMRRIAALFSAVFYMMNLYSLIFIWNFTYGISYAFMYASLPLILALYIKGLDEKKGFRYAILLCLIWIATTSVAYVSPPFIILNWAFLFSYGLFYILVHWKEKTNVKHSFRFTIVVALFWALLSMYWMIPMGFSILEEFAKAGLQSIGLSDISIFKLNSAPLLEALRLAGYWALYEGYKGDPYYPWATSYASSLFLLISFLVPFLAFLPLISRSKNKHVLYFAFLALLGLFLVKGSLPPLENLNLHLFSIPGLLRIFREPIIKFGMIVALAYAFLIGVGVDDLYNYLKKFNYYHKPIISIISLILIIFLLLGIYAWPFWSGDVIYAGGKISASARIKIPSYYYNASNYLGKQNDIFRILPLPFPRLYIVEYLWGYGYSGADPSNWLFPKPTISRNTGDISYETALYLVKLFHEDPTFDIGKTFALLNVKYILLHRDNNWNYTEGLPYWISTSPEGYQLILSSQKNLFLEKSFGKLDLYRNKYWRPLHIYTSTNNILVNGDLNRMIQIIERDDFTPGESILSLVDQLDTQQISALPNNGAFFQGEDFLNLVMSKVRDHVIVIPSDTSVSTYKESIIVSAMFLVDTDQVFDLWIEMPYTLSPGEISVNLDGSTIVEGVRLPNNRFLASSWISLSKVHLSKGNHMITLTVTSGEAIPKKIAFIPHQIFNSTYDALFSSLRNGRIIYVLEPQPLITARYYAGWKGVISTNGKGDPDMIIFSSPDNIPYIDAFPSVGPQDWNVYNSTLIYITASSLPLTINSVLADGTQVSATAWWQTDTSWRTGWPITVPPNQRAIIQINQKANIVTLQTENGPINLKVTDGWTNPPKTKAPLETLTNIYMPKTGNYLLAIKVTERYGNFQTKIDNQSFVVNCNSRGQETTYKYVGPIELTTGYHQIYTSGINITIPVYEGWNNPINWTTTFNNQSYTARYYQGWKPVIRTDGTKPWDTLSFSTIDLCPYAFPLNFTGWNAYNSTLIYIVTKEEPLRIDEILADGKTVTDIIGVWWETDWMGMATKPITYPIIIPPNQKAIIQINHKTVTVTIKTNPPRIENMLLYSLRENESFIEADSLLTSNPTNNISFIYEKINPTKYIVHVNASKPFFLVFSESYHKDWVAYVDGQQIPVKYHFMVNGFANAWYINKTGSYTITLEFWPQRLFYIGSAISITTLILCIIYTVKDKIKIVYKGIRQKNKKV